MIDGVVVTLYGFEDGGTIPADLVLACVREPHIPDDLWDSGYRRELWKETLEKLEAWGDAMVVVRPFGIVHGEFIVYPYLISAEQFDVLCAVGAAR